MRAATHHEQSRLRAPREELLRRREQQVEAPMRLHARDDPDHLVFRRQAERGAHGRVRLRRLEAREVDGAERAGDRTAAAQRCVDSRGLGRHAEQAVGGGAEEPAVPRRARDALGAAVAAHDRRLVAAPARSAPGQHVVARVPAVDDVDALRAEQLAQARGIGAIAEEMHAAAAFHRHGRSKTCRFRFAGE